LGFQGIDPTGATDSSQAIGDAIESPYAVYVPPGVYKIDNPLLFLQPKIFYCFSGLKVRTSLTTNDPADPWPPVTYEQARFFTTNNINMFDIRTPEVHIRGGLYELMHSAPTKAVFYYPIMFFGWGGSIKDVVAAGSETHLHTLNGGGTAIHYDFSTQTVANAYITHHEMDIEVRNMRYGIYADARNPGYDQWANNCHWKVRAQAVKSGIYSIAFNNLGIDLMHQGDSMYLTYDESVAHAGLYLRGTDHHIYTARFFDFGKGQHNNGWWHNHTQYDVEGKDVRIDDQEEFTGRNSIKGNTLWPHINNPVGFIPRTTVAGRRGLFITDLMDEFEAHALPATITWGTYSGTNVIVTDPKTDFMALQTTSALASIPTSSDITLANTANYFSRTLARPTATWNAQAITDNDYVEVVIVGAGAKSFDHMWQVLSCSDNVRPLYIHLLRYSTPGSPSENIWIVTPSAAETRNLLQNHYFPFVNGTSNSTTILRFIGCNIASAPISIHQPYGIREVFYDGRFPTLFRNSVGAIYDFMWMERGGIGDRVETSANLNNIAHEVNTSAYKRQGFCLYNSTVGKPVWAVGSADGDLWKDSAGTTVNTPV